MEPTAVKAVAQTIAADSQQSDSQGGEGDRNRMKEGVLLSFSKLLVWPRHFISLRFHCQLVPTLPPHLSLWWLGPAVFQQLHLCVTHNSDSCGYGYRAEDAPQGQLCGCPEIAQGSAHTWRVPTPVMVRQTPCAWPMRYNHSPRCS